MMIYPWCLPDAVFDTMRRKNGGHKKRAHNIMAAAMSGKVEEDYE